MSDTDYVRALEDSALVLEALRPRLGAAEAALTDLRRDYATQQQAYAALQVRYYADLALKDHDRRAAEKSAFRRGRKRGRNFGAVVGSVVGYLLRSGLNEVFR